MMKISEHLSVDFIDSLYKKVFDSMKDNKGHRTKNDTHKDTERLMGRYKRTLYRGKGGAWK